MKTDVYFAFDPVAQAAPTCQNCGATVTSQHCPNCGQKHPQARITLKGLFHLTYESLVDFDRGLFFTAWQLLIRPHVVIRDYIAGRRTVYTNPMKYMLIWLGVSTFITLAVLDMDKLTQQMTLQQTAQRTAKEKALVEQTQHDAQDFLFQNPQIMYAVLVPLLSLFTLWFFRRVGYNYAEHLLANAYLMAQATLVVIPAYFLYLAFPSHLVAVSFLITVLSTLYYIFGAALLFNNGSGYVKPALKGFAAYASSYLLFMLFIGIVGAAVIAVRVIRAGA